MQMDKERKEKILRLILRSMPFSVVPGPELYELFRDLTKTRTELDRKVEEALASIRNASTVISELEATLTERTTKLEALSSEFERVSKIAAVEEEQAAPILQELESLVSKGRTRERIVAFGINIVAGVIVFLAGAYFGPRLFENGGSASSAPKVTETTAPVTAEPASTKQSQEIRPKTDEKPKGIGQH